MPKPMSHDSPSHRAPGTLVLVAAFPPRVPAAFRGMLLSVFLLLLPGTLPAQIARPGIAPPGLWIGEVKLNQVTELGGNPIPTPTKDTASYRILIHVGADGSTRLLKDVTLATIAITNAGVKSLREVLLTDDQLNRVRPESLNGKPMVQRYGTVAYDWDTPEGTRYLRPFEGILGPNRNCQVRFQTSASSPTNPFRHSKHPAHSKGMNIDRTLILRLGTQEPGGSDQQTSQNRLQGTFEESFGTRIIEGGRLQNFVVRGKIDLTRANTIAALYGSN